MWARAFACGCLAASLIGCLALFDFAGYDTNQPTDEAGPPTSFFDAGQSAFTLTAPAAVRVIERRTADFTVQITRGGGFVGVVSLEVVDPPQGVTFTKSTIAEAATSTTMTATAAAGVPLLAKRPFTIRARNGDVERTAATTVQVVGEPGTLDHTFGVNGLALVEVPGRSIEALDLTTDASGGIVAVGRGVGVPGNDITPDRLLLQRFTADGKVDPMAPALVNTDGLGYRVSVDANGAATALSLVRNSTTTGFVTLSRFLRNNAADPSFASIDFPLDKFPFSLPGFVPRSADLLVAATACNPTCTVGLIGQRRSDGQPDLSFGDGGVVVNDAAPPSIVDLLPLADGRLALLTTAPTGPDDGAIFLLSAQGKIDPSFGHASLIARCGRQQADGRLLVASSPQRPARLELDGGFDRTFGEGGTAQGPAAAAGSSDSDVRCALGVQPDKKILLADVTLVRYQPDGSVDSTFGTAGAALEQTDSGYRVEWVALTLLADGRVLTAGRALGSTKNYFAVGRYWP